MNLAERLKWLRKKHGFASKAVAAAAIGIKYGTYQRYEYGATPSRKKFGEISTYYKCSLSWLMTDEGEPYPNSDHTEKSVGASYINERGDNYPAFQVIPNQPNFPADDFVFIRQVNGHISAGGGLMPEESADFHCAFRRDWIKKRGGKPDSMSLIKVSGDSMEPTLFAGDLVLIDHSRTSVPHQGGIYAISIDHEIMIKRIQVLFPQNKLRILSDNTHYDPIEADPDQVKINGKVIWFGRDMEK